MTKKLLRRAAAGLALLACGCGDPTPSAPVAIADAADRLEAAQAEGEVVWYSTLIVQQAVRPMAEAFERAHPGIEVRYIRQTSSDIALRITTEAQAGRVSADVFDGTATIFPLLEAGLVGRFVPESAAAYPVELVDSDGRWIAMNSYFMTPAYNSSLVAPDEAPQTLDDLLDPRWRGRIAWATDPNVVGPPGFIGAVLETLGEEPGMAYLRRLADQDIVNVPAAQRTVLDQVIAGEYSLALMTFNHHSAISQAQGAPVDWIRMDPAVSTFNMLGLLDEAPHPNAARLFIEYVASEAGQAVLAAANYIPAHPRVPASIPELKPDAGGFGVFVVPPAMTEQRLSEWNEIYRELFQ